MNVSTVPWLTIVLPGLTRSMLSIDSIDMSPISSLPSLSDPPSPAHGTVDGPALDIDTAVFLGLGRVGGEVCIREGGGGGFFGEA
jgi:hypothetical protein